MTAINSHLPKDVQEALQTFVIPHERLVQISEDIQKEFTLGLEYGSAKSSIAMLPSYVPALPDGTGKIVVLPTFSIHSLETGKYVAIDLSGKNLRILLLTLNGPGKTPNVVVNNFIVSNAIMKGTGEQVWKTSRRSRHVKACFSCMWNLGSKFSLTSLALQLHRELPAEVLERVQLGRGESAHRLRLLVPV